MMQKWTSLCEERLVLARKMWIRAAKPGCWVATLDVASLQQRVTTSTVILESAGRLSAFVLKVVRAATFESGREDQACQIRVSQHQQRTARRQSESRMMADGASHGSDNATTALSQM